MSNTGYTNYLLLNQNQLKALNYFWIGFIIYTIGFTLLVTSKINYNVCEGIEILGMVLFVISSFFLLEFKFDNKYLKLVFILYMLWLSTVVFRGFNLRPDFIKIMLFHDYVGIFPFLAPLVLLFPKNLIVYRKIFSVSIILAVVCVLYYIVFIRELMNRDISSLVSKGVMENSARHLALPITFLLLAYSYQSKSIKLLALFVTMLTVFFTIIRARRGLLFSFVNPIIFGYIIFLTESKKKFSMIMIVLFSALIVALFGLQFVNNSSLFNSFKSRVDEDTRSGVEKCFVKDMETSDWIVGRGIDGSYYCPGIDPDDRTGYRTVIETDYLNIILKGGIISLSLLLFITVPAAIKGIFYSKNILSKAAGFWILMWLLSLYPTTGVAFIFSYLLLWICVGICYNEDIRGIPENVMKLYFESFKSLPKNV
ncbi:hypothetical protein ACPPVU_15120 [Mucilaginibacter sp. McL0603]|uniref:hypothetical protein n=1 Tax=Mucilaginibacter sp. McL0603 TaxID=3415670 RepID=UPI003CEFEA48